MVARDGVEPPTPAFSGPAAPIVFHSQPLCNPQKPKSEGASMPLATWLALAGQVRSAPSDTPTPGDCATSTHHRPIAGLGPAGRPRHQRRRTDRRLRVQQFRGEYARGTAAARDHAATRVHVQLLAVHNNRAERENHRKRRDSHGQDRGPR